MIVLVVGGTRSGKSEVAERIATRFGEPVTVVVPASASDAELAERIQVHRARRPATWTTVECGAELVSAVEAAKGTVLVDSLGSWVAASDDLVVDGAALVDAVQRREAPTVIVTEEVGLAVHAPTDAGRRFTDALGDLNRLVSAVAHEVLLVVAGRGVRLRSIDGEGLVP